MADKLIDKLKADFQRRKRKVHVLDMDVWVTPLTVAEETRLATLHPNDGAMRMAETLVLKCRAGDGKPVFGKEDKVVLKNEVAGDALSPLIAAIVGPSVAEQEKN